MSRQVSNALSAVAAAILVGIAVGGVLLVTSGLLLALAVGIPLVIVLAVLIGVLTGKAEIRIERRDD